MCQDAQADAGGVRLAGLKPPGLLVGRCAFEQLLLGQRHRRKECAARNAMGAPVGCRGQLPQHGLGAHDAAIAAGDRDGGLACAGFGQLRQHPRGGDAAQLEHAIAFLVHFGLRFAEIGFQLLPLLEQLLQLFVKPLLGVGAGVSFLEIRG